MITLEKSTFRCVPQPKLDCICWQRVIFVLFFSLPSKCENTLIYEIMYETKKYYPHIGASLFVFWNVYLIPTIVSQTIRIRYMLCTIMSIQYVIGYTVHVTTFSGKPLVFSLIFPYFICLTYFHLYHSFSRLVNAFTHVIWGVLVIHT